MYTKQNWDILILQQVRQVELLYPISLLLQSLWNPSEVWETSGQILSTKSLILYSKRLYDCFKFFFLTRNHFEQHQMRKTNTEFYMKHFKVLVEWNWQWKFTCVCPIYMNFEFYFLEFPMGNCFWCNFRQLFISWAFKKYKKDCNILKIIFVQDFSPPKTETAQFTFQWISSTCKAFLQ